MNNGMFNPYYNPYMGYGNPQSQLQILEQQKREIENRMNSLQGQMPNQGNQPTININNQIPNMQQPKQNYEFMGKFIKSDDEVDKIFNDNLPIILMSSESNSFYIKNLDGSTKKYKFEEIVEEKKNENNSNEDIESLKQQVREQQMSLNKIISLLATQNEQTRQINQVNTNSSQNENLSDMESPKQKQSKPRRTTKNDIIESKGDK